LLACQEVVTNYLIAYFFDLGFIRLFRLTKIKSKLDKITIETMKAEIAEA
jgi:hypothetical protein